MIGNKKIILIIIFTITIVFTISLVVNKQKRTIKDNDSKQIIDKHEMSTEAYSLYEMIGSNFYFSWIGEGNIYRDTKTTYESLSALEKIELIIQYIDTICMKYSNIDYFKEIHIDEISSDDYKKLEENIQNLNISEPVKVYRKDIVDKIGKEIFGDKYTGVSNILQNEKSHLLIQENDEWYITTTLNYYDGDLYKYNIYNEDIRKDNKEITNFHAITYFDRVEKEDDVIYLYDRFIYQEINKKYDGEDKISYYLSSTKKEKLNIEYDKIKEDKDFKKQIWNELNKLNVYKHTFKKGSDGKYYWASTEIDNTENNIPSSR